MKPTKEKLVELYVNQSLSRSDVAKILNVSSTTILKYMKEYGIPRRSVSEALSNKPKSIEHRKKLSDSRKGSKNPNYGKKSPTHGKRHWYTCPNGETVSMRSGWEVWFAEYLKENNIPYQYEPITFNFKDGSAYTPDFLLTISQEFVEVKGWMTPEHKNRIEKFRQEFSDKKLTVADRKYLENLGIDLKKKWIKTKPKFLCLCCKEMYHRKYPSQKYCSIQCRNKAIALGLTVSQDKKPTRKYNGIQQGENNNSSKLNETIVKEIRRLHNCGLNNSQIAKQTHTSPGNVSNVVNWKSWKHVK